MQTASISIHDELAALRAENARLKADIAMRPGSLALLYRIRTAAGFSEYYTLSSLDDDIRALRTSLLETLDLLSDVLEVAKDDVLGPLGDNDTRIIARARQVARGTGDVPQAAE